jgi:ligand-binding sensor domain-containing protein/two-component sensor histidine kinase
MGGSSYAQNQSFNQNYIITKRLLSVEDGLPSRTVKAAAQDKAGFMWFATANGLCRYDGNHFKTFNTKNSKLLSNAISNIVIDAENHLFVMSNAPDNNKGILVNVQVLDLNDYTFKNVEDLFQKMPFKSDRIQKISTDESGSLIFFISSPNQIYTYSKKSGFRFHSDIKNISTTDSINVNNQKKLIPDYKIDTFKQWYVRQGDKYILVHDTIDIRNTGENGIENFFRDKLNNIWFCTNRGVFQVAIRENKFQQLFGSNESIKFQYSIRGIYADLYKKNKSKIYALCESANMLEQSTSRITEINSTPGFALLKRNNQFYISNVGLTRYNPISNSVVTLVKNAGISEIWSMAALSDSILALGGGSGLILYNENSKQINPIQFDSKIKELPKSVYRILKTTKKGWVAVAENGLYFINNQLVIYDYYGSRHPQLEKRLIFTGIYDFYEDRSGVAWFATNGEGLVRWDWNTKNPTASVNIKQFTVDNGLPDNILYRIEEDAFNNLWISSYNGLVRFNKTTFSAKVYQSKDGLANTEFNRVSSFKDENGKIYFGGFNGVDAFDPEELKDDQEVNNVSFQLVDFTKYSAQENKLTDVLNEFNSRKKLTLQVGDRFLTVSFSLLDFENRTHRYAYRIDGVDKDWNYISENTIRISGLPYGDLKLHIKAQLSTGVWNAQEIIIPIEVLKPYYLQTWFWILSFTSLAILFLFIYFIRINSLKNANLKLESKVQERTFSLTKTLNEKELLLSEKNILLTEVHHRVKNNLQVINGLLELRKEGIEDEKARAAFDEGRSGVASISMIN